MSSASRPVIAYHLILTCYGFWLPNDPRGSGSGHVWSEALKPFGPGSKVSTDRSIADRPHDRSFRLAAKQALLRPPVRLTGEQARTVAMAFGEHLRVVGTRCLACVVMPDHAHLVVMRNDRSAERATAGLKAASTRALVQAGLHPFQTDDGSVPPKLWARGSRHPFLYDEADLLRAVRYVEGNPMKTGLRPQFWSFVQPMFGREPK